MTLAYRPVDFPDETASEDPPRADRGSFVAAFRSSDPPPFVLRVEREDGQVVVSDVEVAVYGVGDSEEAAIDDFLASARSHLEALSAEGERLSEQLRFQLRYLGDRLNS